MTAEVSLPFNPPSLLPFAIAFGVLAGFKIVIDQWVRDKRRTYYRDDYLKSDNGNASERSF